MDDRERRRELARRLERLLRDRGYEWHAPDANPDEALAPRLICLEQAEIVGALQDASELQAERARISRWRKTWEELNQRLHGARNVRESTPTLAEMPLTWTKGGRRACDPEIATSPAGAQTVDDLAACLEEASGWTSLLAYMMQPPSGYEPNRELGHNLAHDLELVLETVARLLRGQPVRAFPSSPGPWAPALLAETEAVRNHEETQDAVPLLLGAVRRAVENWQSREGRLVLQRGPERTDGQPA